MNDEVTTFRMEHQASPRLVEMCRVHRHDAPRKVDPGLPRIMKAGDTFTTRKDGIETTHELLEFCVSEEGFITSTFQSISRSIDGPDVAPSILDQLS